MTESVSIDIEDRVMLDKLKGLWKNRAGEEAYIQSIQDKKNENGEMLAIRLGNLWNLRKAAVSRTQAHSILR